MIWCNKYKKSLAILEHELFTVRDELLSTSRQRDELAGAVRKAERDLFLKETAIKELQLRLRGNSRLLNLELPDEVYTVLHDARLFVKGTDSDRRSDEAKRHIVYSQLLDKYPDVKRRNLALAIEVAVQEAP